MSVDLDSLFDGMSKASLNDKGAFFTEGVYRVEPVSLRYNEGFKGKSFIGKFKVLETNNPEHPVGCTRSWILKLDNPKTKSQVMGDIKALFFALLGKRPRDVKAPEIDPKSHEEATKFFKASIDEAFAKKNNIDPQLFIGMPVDLECVGIKTGAGNDFTKHAWNPVPE